MTNTNTLTEKTVAEIVAEDYRTAEIFKRHGIDFCCGGKKTIDKVCAEKKIDPEKLEHELYLLQVAPVNAQQNYNDWKLSFLADYIVNIHHKYVNDNLSLISEFAAKVAKVHGQHNIETVEINTLWKAVSDELTVHMKKEELILFPFIKALERYMSGELKELPPYHFSSVENPIRMMEDEHESVGTLMHRIEKTSNNFTPPDHACNTYRVLYAKLKEFQDDLMQHIHLENNILFPKAIVFEKNMRKGG
jgi:regulator of cell morphogenesis and NO signaling